VLIFVVDPNDLKPILIKEVAQETGYTLTIDGQLTWSLFPRLAVNAEHVRLTAPNRNVALLDARDMRVIADFDTLMANSANIKADIEISRARLSKMNMQRVNATVQWKDGVLTINPIQAFLYQGELHGSATGQSLDSMPKWQWDLQAKNVDVKSLLQDVNGDDSKINIGGRAQLKFQADSQGRTHDELLTQLNGTGDFSLTDGALSGFDLNYLIQAADAFVNQRTSIELENQRQTAFAKLTGSFVINNGSAETNNLLLLANAFSAKAKGSVALQSHELDFEFKVKPLPVGKVKWRIPVLVDGTLERPDVRLDTLEIQQLLAGEQIERVKQKAAEQIQKHVHGHAGELLQKLLR
jgi:AsmA protein